MDDREEATGRADGSQLPRQSRRAWWLALVAGLMAGVVVTVLAFAAYQQPELLLNLVGLRYCG